MSEAAKPVPSAVLERIREIVGPEGWISDAGAMHPYLVDRRELYHGRAPMVVRPASTDEVSRVVGVCAESATAIVPQGGNTGLCGGAVPHDDGSEIVLSLSRMERVREVDAVNDTITVEAGCILADVQAAAAEADRLFPLSLGAEGSCRIGGNLSTNAGGTAVLRYGTARDLVLGLEVVLADGRVWDGLRALRKDNTGYDLKQLFLGAEGTLGIITAAVLKLFPRPREVQVAFAGLASAADAVALFSRARAAAGDAVTGFELLPRIGLEFVLAHIPGSRDPLAAPHPWYVLVELSGPGAGDGLGALLEEFLAAAADDGLLQDAAIAASEAQARALWRLREDLAEAQVPEGASIKHDISVPLPRIPEFIARAAKATTRAIPGSRPIAFGHIGDGNVHFNLSQPPGADRGAFLAEWSRINRMVHDLAAELGGSISAEHGLGQLKREEILRYKSAVEMELMRTLKRALDPKGIMNPGKVV
jgi:FAD/FMN-containing dehydrogenase